MDSHYRYTDDEFVSLFANQLLDPALFSHEAHIRLAWLHIRKEGKQKAIELICDQILQFSRKAGGEEKFNLTLTIAAVNVVAHLMEKSGEDNFRNFIDNNNGLLTNFREYIITYSNTDIFNP